MTKGKQRATNIAETVIDLREKLDEIRAGILFVSAHHKGPDYAGLSLILKEADEKLDEWLMDYNGGWD
jgi:uncharacterized membrane protein YfbV (UPF0208 family)